MNSAQLAPRTSKLIKRVRVFQSSPRSFVHASIAGRVDPLSSTHLTQCGSIRIIAAAAQGSPGSQAGQRDPEAGIGFFRAGTRPAAPLIVGFIDEYRQVYGVESICDVLTEHGIQIAPRTYRKARRRPPSARDVTDAYLENALRDLQGKPEQMYQRRKMTRYLRRQGDVAFCTVDRIMRRLGLDGVVRGRKQRTTIPAKDGNRAVDRLNHDFTRDRAELALGR